MSTGESSLPSQRLLGKVALVTGGATGIGESIVRLFHRHGAKVLIVDIKDDLGRQLCSSLNSSAHYLHCDVTVEADVARAVDHAVETFGALDIMVNNAGVAGRPVPDIRDFTFSEFREVFNVNVNGVFLGAKHAARAMVPRGKGSIVSLASVSSVLGGLGPHAYTASKHAVVGLTKSMAAEMGKHGVRVNCVSPYAVPTSLALPHLPEGEGGEGVLKWFREFTGGGANLKGVDLEAADVAEAVLYLASDEARYVSGLNLVVDGGFTVVNHSLRVFR
ncbi:Xanthoxin dehydrogenase [Acorus calamus]|uniref:Xanthoxin dehydrogenase n=1 Tax=Acorus calamus TaxID=4465 RepID=A0AAV9F1X4_ACOCL|nr:Xanthoxin dehydrogenase [Acorus calamus]